MHVTTTSTTSIRYCIAAGSPSHATQLTPAYWVGAVGSSLGAIAQTGWPDDDLTLWKEYITDPDGEPIYRGSIPVDGPRRSRYRDLRSKRVHGSGFYIISYVSLILSLSHSLSHLAVAASRPLHADCRLLSSLTSLLN